MAAGAILVLRPVLPGCAAVPRRRAVPVRRADARARRRHVRPRPGRRAPRLLGRRRGSRPAAAWWGRGSTGLTSTLLGDGRRPHHRGLPVRSPRCCCSPARRSPACMQGHHATPSPTTTRALRTRAPTRRAARAPTSWRRSSAPPRRGAERRDRADAGAADVLGRRRRVRETRARAALDLSAVPRPARSSPPTPPRGAGATRARRARPPSASLAEDPARTSPASRASLEPSSPRTSRRRAATARSVTDSPDFVVDAARPALPQALDGRGRRARHRRPGEDRRRSSRGARPLRRRGAASSAWSPARTSPATSCGSRPASRSPRSPSSRTTSPTRSPRRTSASSRRSPASRRSASRSPTRAAGSSTSATSSRTPPAGLVAADRLARQGRRRPRDRRRPGQDAAPAGGRHDRRRQVGRGQRDALLDPAARDAARGAAGARRPQAGRAQPLRLDPAPADAGDHVAAQGRHRAAEPRARDGAALLVHVARPHALADRAQQGARVRATRRRCPTSCA